MDIDEFFTISKSLGIDEKKQKVDFFPFPSSLKEQFIPMGTGRSISRESIYPWVDEQYQADTEFDSWFKPMGYDDEGKKRVKANKGRPSPPPSAAKAGFHWRTKGGHFPAGKKEVWGYWAIRVSDPDKQTIV